MLAGLRAEYEPRTPRKRSRSADVSAATFGKWVLSGRVHIVVNTAMNFMVRNGGKYVDQLRDHQILCLMKQSAYGVISTVVFSQNQSP
jgi:hypothetical protein